MIFQPNFSLYGHVIAIVDFLKRLFQDLFGILSLPRKLLLECARHASGYRMQSIPTWSFTYSVEYGIERGYAVRLQRV